MHAQLPEYLTLGLVSDPNIVEDVWQVSDDLHESYQELKAAVGAHTR